MSALMQRKVTKVSSIPAPSGKEIGEGQISKMKALGAKTDRDGHVKMTLDQVEAVFKGTGITAPASISMDSTAYIPQSNELSGYLGEDIAGNAKYLIVRKVLIPSGPGTKKVYDEMVVATADPEPGMATYGEWFRNYAGATPHDRAWLLGAKDWIELQQRIIAGAVQASNARPAGTTSSSYTSKVTLVACPENSGVMTGQSEAGKKRITWFGHSGFSLARYLGANGWTGSEAVATFDKIGVPMGKTAIIGGCYAGKSGTRGEPAKVTPDQHKILQSHLDEFRAGKAKVEETKSAAVEAKIDSEPADPKVIRKVTPAPAAPAQTKEQRLAAAMTAKADQRKANKAAAVAKGQATKAANKAAKA